MSFRRPFTLSLCLGFALAGCATVSPWEQAGAEFGKGMSTQLNKDAPPLVENVIKTAGDGLRKDILNPETNQKLAQATAEAVSAAGDAANAKLPLVRETLTGKQSQEELQRLMLALMTVVESRGKRTARGVMDEVGAGIHDDVLSKQNEARLNEMLVSLGGTARGETARLRDEVLSQQTDKALRVIVATAMDEVVNASEEIRQKAHNELSFVQKNAAESIIAAGIVGALIAYAIWRQKEKNRILLNLLLAQVHNTSKDREEEIFGRLEQQAQQLGVLGPLKNALASVGKTLRG
jgi:hypothetical protein